MRRLYLRIYEKTLLSLRSSKWLELKFKSVAQSVVFLYWVAESLWSVPMWILMSMRDIS